MEIQASFYSNRFLSPLAHFFPNEVSYEGAGNALSGNVIFFLKFRYRSPNKFLVALLHIAFIHSCMKNVSYEWHQMKEEDPSFPNMYHLFIIIMNEIWLNNDKSRFRFFWDALYNSQCVRSAARLWMKIKSEQIWEPGGIRTCNICFYPGSDYTIRPSLVHGIDTMN